MALGPSSAYNRLYDAHAARPKEFEEIMGSFGPIHWIIVAGVILLLFGGRIKLSSIMGDAAKGIKAFRDGLKDEHEASSQAAAPAPLPSAEKEKDTVAR